MIFVTLGTHELPFNRLIKSIEQAVLDGNISETVIIQAGNTKYKSTHELIQVKAYFEIEAMKKLYQSCNYLITHGGVGSISTGLKYNKRILVLPRYQKYKEHTSDHQLEIVRAFKRENRIVVCYEDDLFNNKLRDLFDFKPNFTRTNKTTMLQLIDEFIKDN